MVPQYTPMIPTLVQKRFHRPGWVYEEKVDGWRMLAYKDGAHVRLVSRNGVDHARRFAEVAGNDILGSVGAIHSGHVGTK